MHTVVLRLGALLVLMMTVGQWSDVLQVLITFLGEAVCLLPSQDLLQAVLKVCVKLKNSDFTSIFYSSLFYTSSYHFYDVTISVFINLFVNHVDRYKDEMT